MIKIELPNPKMNINTKIEFNNKDEFLSSLFSSLDDLWELGDIITKKRGNLDIGLVEVNIYVTQDEDAPNQEEINKLIEFLKEYYSKKNKGTQVKSVKLGIFKVSKKKAKDTNLEILGIYIRDFGIPKYISKRKKELGKYKFLEDWKNFVSFLNSTNREEFERIKEFLNFIENVGF